MTVQTTMRRSLSLGLVLAGLAGALAATALPRDAAAQERQRQDSAFNWAGRIPSSGWLRVYNVNGRINVQPGTGDRAEVVASKTWRRGDPKDVRIEVVRDGDNVTICALWRESSECTRGGIDNDDDDDDNWRGRRNDVAVEFTVRLPRGANVNVGTVNGSVDVRDVSGQVVASTVNGGVDAVTTSGPVRASTVNGAVRVRMARLTGDDDLDFSTVNGSVSVELPDPVDAEIEMSTVNGGLRSDFPMTVTGRIDPRHMRATLGRGGRRIRLKTVNGSVELRKGA
jgi:hypothetical protein